MYRLIFGCLLLFCSSCMHDPHKVLNIAGSDTILELVQMQAEDFFHLTKVPINCTGGGSGVGIRMVQTNTLDIANSSRELQGQEMTKDLVQIPVAIDLITIIVNETNPIKNLSLEQLKEIYTGKISNWKQLGWRNLPISLYGRQSSSGTYQFLRHKALHDEDFSLKVKEMTGNSQIIRSLETDIAGIAYIAYGYYYPKQDVLNALSIDGIFPSSHARDQNYPLMRDVFQIYNQKNSNLARIRTWFAYVFSPRGQKIVTDIGFLPIDEPTQTMLKNKIGIS